MEGDPVDPIAWSGCERPPWTRLASSLQSEARNTLTVASNAMASRVAGVRTTPPRVAETPEGPSRATGWPVFEFQTTAAARCPPGSARTKPVTASRAPDGIPARAVVMDRSASSKRDRRSRPPRRREPATVPSLEPVARLRWSVGELDPRRRDLAGRPRFSQEPRRSPRSQIREAPVLVNGPEDLRVLR